MEVANPRLGRGVLPTWISLMSCTCVPPHGQLVPPTVTVRITGNSVTTRLMMVKVPVGQAAGKVAFWALTSTCVLLLHNNTHLSTRANQHAHLHIQLPHKGVPLLGRQTSRVLYMEQAPNGVGISGTKLLAASRAIPRTKDKCRIPVPQRDRQCWPTHSIFAVWGLNTYQHRHHLQGSGYPVCGPRRRVDNKNTH